MNNILEISAVSFGLLYLILATIENTWCWVAVIFSSALFTIVFAHQALYMSVAVQAYYAAMAVYGWYHWSATTDGLVTHGIRSLPRHYHTWILLVIVLLTLVSGALLSQLTLAKGVYIDSLLTWGSIITTYMVTQKIIENWLYWIVLDSIAAVFYSLQNLPFTALLFVLYTVIAIAGYYRWRLSFNLTTVRVD